MNKSLNKVLQAMHGRAHPKSQDSEAGTRKSPKFEASLRYTASFCLKNKIQKKKTTKIFSIIVADVVQIYQLALGTVH